MKNPTLNKITELKKMFDWDMSKPLKGSGLKEIFCV